MQSPKTIVALWDDLRHAKDKLLFACSVVSDAEDQIPTLPFSDGNYGYQMALRQREVAMSYFGALANFKAAVMFGGEASTKEE